MSNAQAVLKKGLRELEDEVTCPVCQGMFEDPKILPCGHYYCKRCVLQLAARGQPFPCPECRGDTLLPPTGADGFPTAFFVHRLKSAYSAMEKKVQEATYSADLVSEQCQYGAVGGVVDMAPPSNANTGKVLFLHENDSSNLLSPEENQTVFSILGSRKQASSELSDSYHHMHTGFKFKDLVYPVIATCWT